jgi:tRNA (mo5U34)-methyltransferase
MKTASLAQQAYDFHDHLLEIKNRTPLPAEHLRWYPWVSLAGMEALHGFVDGDLSRVARMTGLDPVLDVGCGDGDVAFFLESKLGVHVDCIDQPPSNYNAMYGVRELKRVLNSNIGIYDVDLDARPSLPAERYGLAMVLGILYHLKNPFLVLDALANRARYMFLSTRIASLSPDHKTNFGHLAMAYLVDADELNDDPTNFWIFTEPGLRRILRRSGWDVQHYTTLARDGANADPVSTDGDVRAYLLAKSRHMRVIRGMELGGGWHALEFDRQRWTERRFSVTLDLAAAVEPARLRFHFQLHEAVLGTGAPISLRATVNGTPLAPRVFSTAGWHEFTGELESLEPGKVLVEFELDRALGPSAADLRELGVLVDFAEAAPVELW